ncbi:hypothetical protein HHL28_09935 [Aerophototrophica crusticola]|uniref:Uncharacterized protein n=1 Tax=Aerophototrophica crusticola TaxID=1709002 RepID=A0A858R7J4_9PROT|nr:hypothetical protein HHL28_09935 [Rhodospirillaceae bacterium B3]
MVTGRPRHPSKEIEGAVSYAESQGWTFVKGRGHCWGMLRCPANEADCRCGEFCQVSVWSTPRVPENEARKIRRAVDGCIFGPGDSVASMTSKRGRGT